MLKTSWDMGVLPKDSICALVDHKPGHFLHSRAWVGIMLGSPMDQYNEFVGLSSQSANSSHIVN